MVASVDSDNLQPFRLELKGSADDPVTHNSEWKSPTALDIPPPPPPPGIHVRVGYLDASRCGSCEPIYQACAAMKYHDQRIIARTLLSFFVHKVIHINLILFQISTT